MSGDSARPAQNGAVSAASEADEASCVHGPLIAAGGRVGDAGALQKITAGIIVPLIVLGIGWIAYTETQILQVQSAQAERFEAVIYRMATLEAKINDRHYYSRDLAEQHHQAMQGNINHNWETIQHLEVRTQQLEAQMSLLRMRGVLGSHIEGIK